MAFEPQTYPYGPSGRKRRPMVQEDPLAPAGALPETPTEGPSTPSPVAPVAPASTATQDYFAPIGVMPQDAAQGRVERNYGSGIPPMPRTAPAPSAAQRIAEANARAGQAKALNVARSIARTDPRSWQDRIEKFNRGVGEAGLAISMDDVVGQARRPNGDEQPGIPQGAPSNVRGGYGSAPLVVGERQGGRGNTIQTPNGTYRVQRLGGRMTGVPVMDFAGGAVPDPDLPSADFDRAYSKNDAASVAKSLYQSGFTEFSVKQRRIDAARAALDDETLRPEERARAEIELNGRENRLHQEFLRSVGRRVTSETTGAALQDLNAPDPQDVIKYTQDAIDRGVPEAQARSYGERRARGDTSATLPMKDRPERQDARDRFNYPRFAESVAQRVAGATAPGRTPDEKAIFGQALDDAMGGVRISSLRQGMNGEIDALLSDVRDGQIDPADVRSALIEVVRAHLPLWAERVKANGRSEIEKIADELLDSKIRPTLEDQANVGRNEAFTGQWNTP